MKINEREFFDYSMTSQVPFTATEQQRNDDFQKTLESSVKKEDEPVSDVALTEDRYERSNTTDSVRSDEDVSNRERKEKVSDDRSSSENKKEVKEKSTVEVEEKSTTEVKEKDVDGEPVDKEGQKEAETTVQKPASDKELNSKDKTKVAETKEVVTEVKADQLQEAPAESKKDDSALLKDKPVVKGDQEKVKASVEKDNVFAGELESAEDGGEDGSGLNGKVNEKNDLASGESSVKQEAPSVKKSEKINNDLQITFVDSKSEAAEQKEAVTQVQGASKVLEQYQEFRDKILKNIENGVKIAVNRPEGQISIKLQPPELGRMDIHLSVKENGVSAEILTENHAVKEVILTNLEQLKSNLENANLSLNNVDVSTGDLSRFTDQKLGNGNSSSGNGKRSSGKEGGGINPPVNDNQIINSAPVTQFLGRSLNLLI